MYMFSTEASVQAKIESHSEELRRANPGEVFEVLEGPRKEEPFEVTRTLATASKDKKEGWLTIQDGFGNSALEQCPNIYVVKHVIAITPGSEIGTKPIRKL